MQPPRALPIRDEAPPPDDWLVLRGGSNAPIGLRTKIERSIEFFGIPLISVIVVHPTLLDRALNSQVLTGYRVVSFCLVGDVRGSDFRLIPTFRAPHYSVELPDSTDASMYRFIDIFTKRMENPFHEY